VVEKIFTTRDTGYRGHRENLDFRKTGYSLPPKYSLTASGATALHWSALVAIRLIANG
jgi:hypothetical protein